LTAFLDFPAAVFGPGRTFWQSVTATTLSPTRGAAGQFATLLPVCGDAFLRLQRIDRGSPGCHLDVHTEDIQATVRRAVDLGAVVVDDDRLGLVIMSSPAGVVFCLAGHGGEAERPAPCVWPGGHRSLVDQISLDVEPGAFAPECAFWTALTGWERRSGSRPEFTYLVRPPGIPLRIILQRLDRKHADGCGAHLDLACDDMVAERRRHEALGATLVRSTTNWTTLRDPAGLEYCITRRNPETGML
jgi:hypothetical protein